MNAAERQKFIETFGFEPNQDDVKMVRPAIYEVDPKGWGYVYIGELAHVIGTTPLELVSRFWPLESPGMTLNETIIFVYLEGSNAECGAVDNNVGRIGYIRPGYTKRLNPRILVSAGWSQRVIKAYNAGVTSVHIENLDHSADCPAGTVYCCKVRSEEDPGCVPLDIVGQTKDGTPYNGPVLWYSIPSKTSRSRHSHDICGND